MTKLSYLDQQMALIPESRRSEVLKQTDLIIAANRSLRLRESIGKHHVNTEPSSDTPQEDAP
jgi:hypothetical protein